MLSRSSLSTVRRAIPPIAARHKGLGLAANRGDYSTGKPTGPRLMLAPIYATLGRGGVRPTNATPVAVPDVYIENADPEIAAFQQHQKKAARPTPAEQARTLLETSRFVVMGSVSIVKGIEGFPQGNVNEFVVDDDGRVIIATSTLSPLAADLEANGRCSITALAPESKGVADARCTLVGTMAAIPEEERPAARERFLAKYPNAFWVDFGDFRWFRTESLLQCRFFGGFGLGLAKVAPEQFLAAKADPVSRFAAPVCGHMNADHEDDTKAMVQHYACIKVERAKLIGLDRLGLDVEATRAGSSFKMRLPFIRPAEDRKGVKEVIVEMTRTAREAVAKSAS